LKERSATIATIYQFFISQHAQLFSLPYRSKFVLLRRSSARDQMISNTLTSCCIIIDDHVFFQLAGAGYGVGVRMLELVSFRDKQCKREIKASSLTCTPRSNHFSFGSFHWVFEILTPSIIFFTALQIVAMLSFIKETMWKTMFGKPADSLERVTDKEDECAFYPEVSSRLDQGLPISLPLSVSPCPSLAVSLLYLSLPSTWQTR
jgi:hypothetical protein